VFFYFLLNVFICIVTYIIAIIFNWRGKGVGAGWIRTQARQNIFPTPRRTILSYHNSELTNHYIFTGFWLWFLKLHLQVKRYQRFTERHGQDKK